MESIQEDVCWVCQAAPTVSSHPFCSCLPGLSGQGLDMEKCKDGGKPWVGEPVYASVQLK